MKEPFIQLQCAGCKELFLRQRNWALKTIRSGLNSYCSMVCRNFGLKADNDPEKRERALSEFWAKVDKTPGHGPNGDCWEWSGAKDKHGYGLGTITLVKGTGKAHRVSYILTYGDFARSLCVCHKCDNPSCCRPDHLFLGTPKENLEDCKNKGRNFIPTGSLCGTSVFTDEQVVELRKDYSNGKYKNVQDMARILGFNHQTLMSMLKGKSYSNIPGACKIKHFQPAQNGEKNPCAVLTTRDAKRIRRLKANKPYLTSREIVSRLKLSCSIHVVLRILRGESYK